MAQTTHREKAKKNIDVFSETGVRFKSLFFLTATLRFLFDVDVDVLKCHRLHIFLMDSRLSEKYAEQC